MADAGLQRRLDTTWKKISGCRRCLDDRTPLEGPLGCGRTRSVGQILRGEPVFVPLPSFDVQPVGSRRAWLIVGQEPSTRARSQREAERAIKEGKRNFGGGDKRWMAALRFALDEWLCEDQEGFVMTDVAKCAMVARTSVVEQTRAERFSNCAPWLEAEMRILRPRGLIALGNAAYTALRTVRRTDWPPIFKLMHHASRGAPRLSTGETPPRLPRSVRRKFERFQSRRLAALREREVSYKATENQCRWLAVFRAEFKSIKKAAAKLRVRTA